MITTTTGDRAGRDRRRRRLLLVVLFGGAFAVLLGILTAVALISDPSLLLPEPDGPDASGVAASITTDPTDGVLTFEGMAPGDSVENRLVVSNRGNAPLRYSLRTTSTNEDGKGLRDVLILTIRGEDSSSDGCDRFDGALLYEGPAADAAFGDASPGDDRGDRPLAAGASEVLCLRAELPIEGGGVDQRHQGATTTLTFTFAAERAGDP